MGTTPRSTTSHPTDSRPGTAARASMGPDVLESRPTKIGPSSPSDRRKAPKAAAIPAISSGVRGAPTLPRTPDTLTMRSDGSWTGTDSSRTGLEDGITRGRDCKQ